MFSGNATVTPFPIILHPYRSKYPKRLRLHFHMTLMSSNLRKIDVHGNRFKSTTFISFRPKSRVTVSSVSVTETKVTHSLHYADFSLRTNMKQAFLLKKENVMTLLALILLSVLYSTPILNIYVSAIHGNRFI